MTDGTLELRDGDVKFLASVLTEHAQVQRSVRNHERADEIEQLRNLIYQQQSHLL